MKFSIAAGTLLAVASSASTAYGFTPTSRSIATTRLSTNPISHLRSSSITSLQLAKEGSDGTPLNVGIVGATGAVGKEIVGCLEKRSFPVNNLRIFGSERSAGREVDTDFGKVTVELFSEDSARECDVVFLAVDGDFSLAHAENICKGDDGAVVIDNSSAFRYVDGVPLVVPEINAETTKGKKLIANPNCTTAIGLMAIWPLHKLFGLKSMIMSVRQILCT